MKLLLLSLSISCMLIGCNTPNSTTKKVRKVKVHKYTTIDSTGLPTYAYIILLDDAAGCYYYQGSKTEYRDMVFKFLSDIVTMPEWWVEEEEYVDENALPESFTEQIEEQSVEAEGEDVSEGSTDDNSEGGTDGGSTSSSDGGSDGGGDGGD